LTNRDCSRKTLCTAHLFKASCETLSLAAMQLKYSLKYYFPDQCSLWQPSIRQINGLLSISQQFGAWAKATK